HNRQCQAGHRFSTRYLHRQIRIMTVTTRDVLRKRRAHVQGGRGHVTADAGPFDATDGCGVQAQARTEGEVPPVGSPETDRAETFLMERLEDRTGTVSPV